MHISVDPVGPERLRRSASSVMRVRATMAVAVVVATACAGVGTFFAVAPWYARHELSSPQVSVALRCIDLQHYGRRSSVDIARCVRHHVKSGVVRVSTERINLQ